MISVGRQMVVEKKVRQHIVETGEESEPEISSQRRQTFKDVQCEKQALTYLQNAA